MAERNTVTEANSPDNAPPQPLLDDEQLDRLDDFLDSEQVGEDALDLISAHGFLVALAVAPSEQPTEQWLEELFQGEPNYRDAAEREEIIQLLSDPELLNAVMTMNEGEIRSNPSVQRLLQREDIRQIMNEIEQKINQE